MVAVRRITLESFRNYPHLSLACEAAPVVLIGENGAGKTNCLEALSLLAPGRGLRQARLEDIQCRETAAPWAAAFACEGYQGPAQIGLGRDPEAPDKRIIRLDGKTQRSQTALAAHMAVLWLTPDMDRLLADGNSDRRRFMDRMVYALHPAHLTHINRYEESMRERNRLLAGPERAQESWLAALEDNMARDGIAIAAARLDWQRALLPFLAIDVAPFPALTLNLDGAAEQHAHAHAAVDAEDTLRALYREGRVRDRESGTTQTGPHRTVLRVTHCGNGQMAEHCSTGEQKALIIRLILAQAQLLQSLRGSAPLLLLDDIMAHLDPVRRDALAAALLALGAQAWLSGTEAAFFSGLGKNAQFFHVRQGHLTPLDG